MQALQAAKQEAWNVKQHASALERDLLKQRSEGQLARNGLESELLNLRNDTAVKGAHVATLQKELEEAREGWRREVAARVAAEESERKAMENAKMQVSACDVKCWLVFASQSLPL